MQIHDEHYYLDPLDNSKPTEKPMQKKSKKEIPMPFIKGDGSKKRKVIITEDWYVKQKKKHAAERAMDKKDMQLEMMRLVAKRDRIRYKLGELNPHKKKDSKKIIAYNEELKDIDAQLKMLQEQSGIKLDELDHGTKLGRFVGKIKRAWKRFTKKVKKVYERNEALIVGIASVVIPIVGGIIIKGILGLFG